MTFEYEKLLLSKSTQNKVASNIAILQSLQSKSGISYMPRVFWDKFIHFTDKPVVQCHTQAVKNTSSDKDDNDDYTLNENFDEYT